METSGREGIGSYVIIIEKGRVALKRRRTESDPAVIEWAVVLQSADLPLIGLLLLA